MTGATSHGPLYVVVEKILEPREHMPQEWPVHGTSGYDFVYFANNIFIQARKREGLQHAIYERRAGPPRQSGCEIIYRAKLQVMQNSLASEVHVLTNMLSQIAAADRHARDFTDNILESVIRETIACFPVYRTYTDERGTYPERDIAFIHSAHRAGEAAQCRYRRHRLQLSGRHAAAAAQGGAGNESGRVGDIDPQQLRFALKFQQLTGPVMAKGVEDTTFYVYNRFVSSNEVGVVPPSRSASAWSSGTPATRSGCSFHPTLC